LQRHSLEGRIDSARNRRGCQTLFRANKTILLFGGVDVFSAETEPHDSA